MSITPKQQQILEKSITLFRKKGYTETTMNDIADAVNMKGASLYSHISSKSEILMWMCNNVEARFSKIPPEVRENQGEAVEKLRLFIYRHIEEILKNKDEYDVFLRYWKFLDNKNKKRYKELYQKYISFAKSLFDNMIPYIESPSCLHKDHVVFTLLQIMNHVPRWVVDEHPDLDEVTDDIIKKFLFGFKGGI